MGKRKDIVMASLYDCFSVQCVLREEHQHIWVVHTVLLLFPECTAANYF